MTKKTILLKGKNVGVWLWMETLKGAWHPAWHECVINNFPTYLREKRTKEIIDYFASKGTPRNQIFFSGHSCGGWNSLKTERKISRCI